MSTVQALRLNTNGPRRVRFSKTSAKTAVTYGRLAFVSDDELDDIQKKDGKFFSGLTSRGQMTLIKGASEKEVEREHARFLADEIKRPRDVAQSWSVERDKDTGIPTMTAGSFDSDSREDRGEGDGAAVAMAKANKKQADFARVNRAKKGAAPSAA